MRKKYMVLLVLITCLPCSAWALELPLVNGDFELPGTIKIGTWDDVVNDIPGWTSDAPAPQSGVEMGYASATGGDWSGVIFNRDPSVYNICIFSILPHRTYTLYVDAQDNWTSVPPAVFKMSLFYQTATERNEIVSRTMELPNTWMTYSISFDVADYPAALDGYIGVELYNTTDSAADSWIGVDNVKIVASDFVTLINPADGSTQQPIGSVLQWTVDTGWPCDVYFGTDPDAGNNPLVIANETAGSYEPPVDLPYATTHYWTVEAIDPNDGNPFPQPGPVWTFKIISDVPEITDQPESVAAFIDDTVQMAISATSAFMPHSYRWYRADVALTDDIKHSGTDTDTLTIHDIDANDDMAEYYCQVTNSRGTVSSETAMVMIKRLLAHYKFENNVNDELGQNDGSVRGGQPGYVSGVDGMAIESDRSAYIRLSTDAYPKAGVGNGLLKGTVSCWIKIGYIGNEYRMFGNVNSGTGNAILLKAPVGENDFLGLAGFWIRDNAGVGVEVWTSVGVCDAQWHHLAATWDSEEGFARIYVDGVQQGQAFVGGMGDFAAWENPTTILAGMDAGSVVYNYAEPLDELQFYNYAMTGTEIAGLYYEQTGIELCAVDYPVEYDLSGPEGEPDCSLDIYDLAALYSSWLDCGLYPECP